MNDIRQQIEQVFQKGNLISLGTVDESGPWVSDVFYVHDEDLNIYWISRKQRRHSKALRIQPKVAGSITIVRTIKQKDLGLQLEGFAQELTKVPSIAPLYWKKRGGPPKVPITKEHAWYKLQPTKIELIDEARFGHTKKIISCKVLMSSV